MNYLQLIERKNPLKKKWQEVVNTMATHVHGKCPEHIFKERRPLESQDNNLLRYRKDNFRPVTQGEFNKAIDDYLTVASKVDYNILWGDNIPFEKMVWLGWRKVELIEWFIDTVGRNRQSDPNAIIFGLPQHKEEFIPAYYAEIPDFNTMINEQVSLIPALIPSEDIIAISDKYVIVRGGDWTLSDETEKPYYWVVDNEYFYLIYPEIIDRDVVYKQIEYYKNIGEVFPVIPIGTNLTNDNGKYYYLPDYWGAAAWGDKVTGQESDLQVCETRFTYPRHWALRTKCNNFEATMIDGLHVHASDNSVCKMCGGSGYIMDMSPFGTRWIDADGELAESKFTQPEGFVNPPAEILQHSGDRVSYYFDMMLNSLGIFKQNQTNQSGVSKEYDIMHKTSTVENIVRWIYQAYEMFLNYNNMYLQNTMEVEPIYVELPEKIDVMNVTDLQVRISDARESGLPYPIIVNMVKSYMLKVLGDSDIDLKIIEWLSKNDKLFAFGVKDLQTAKSVLGGNISDRDITIHQMGFEILKAWDMIENATEEEISNYLNEVIPQPQQLL